MFYTHAYTNIGKMRTNNEDRVIVNGKILSEDERYFSKSLNFLQGCVVVADGMGGGADGEVAATMIVDYFKNHDVQFDEYEVNRALSAINHQVIEYSNNKLDGETSGSTVAGVLTLNEEILFFNAGDSLIYSFEDGNYTELSIAHDTATYERIHHQVSFGRPGLLQFIGSRRGNQYFPYNIAKRRINENEVIFLSSDGVTHYFPEPRTLAAIFKEEKDLAICAEKIIAHVLETRVHDNFSFAIVTKKSWGKPWKIPKK